MESKEEQRQCHLRGPSICSRSRQPRHVPTAHHYHPLMERLRSQNAIKMLLRCEADSERFWKAA